MILQRDIYKKSNVERNNNMNEIREKQMEEYYKH